MNTFSTAMATSYILGALVLIVFILLGIFLKVSEHKENQDSGKK